MNSAVLRRRRWTDRGASAVLVGCVLLSLAVLLLVVGYTAKQGAAAFRPSFFTQSMKGVGPLDSGGGLYHAIVGTLEQVSLANLPRPYSTT